MGVCARVTFNVRRRLTCRFEGMSGFIRLVLKQKKAFNEFVGDLDAEHV